MNRFFITSAAALILSAGIAAAADAPAGTADLAIKLGERAGALAAGKPGEYAREMVDEARKTIAAAQAAQAAGSEKLARLNLEMAELQLNVAEAKAAEKDASEQTALRRAELKKQEAQLDRYMQGEE